MNKKKLLLILPLVVSGAALAGCHEEVPEHNVKWLTPIGSPTLAFYTEAENSNWITTSNPAQEFPQAFMANKHDALVFDGVAGLNVLSKNSDKSNYVFYDFINEGSFYVVSRKHTKDDKFTKDSKVQGFVQKGNAASAFRKLAVDNWKWYESEEEAIDKVTWEPGIKPIVESILKNDSFDYYIVAEPMLTIINGKFNQINNANKDKEDFKEIKLNIIKDLQTEWGSEFPAAGLFVNKESMKNHPSEMKKFLEMFKANRKAVALGEKKVFDYLDQFNEKTNMAEPEKKKSAKPIKKTLSFNTKFGFPSPNIVKATQAGGKNKLAYLEESYKDNQKVASEFNQKLGRKAFSSDLFYKVK